MKSLSISATALGAVLLLAGCSSSGGAAPEASGDAEGPVALTVAVYGSGEEGVIDIAEREGYFEEAGITVEKMVIGAPPAVIAATQAGEVDVAMTPVIPGLTAMANGVPLVIVGAVDGFPAENAADFDSGVIVTNPESGITDLEGLAGATISVPARGAMFEVVITSALVDSNVDPSTINWVTMDFGASLDAVANGDVDAAPMISPLDAQARDMGLIELGNPGSMFTGEGPVDLWVSSPATVEAKGDAIRAFRDATFRAGQWGNDNPEEMKQLSVEISGLDLDLADVKQIWFETSINEKNLRASAARLVELGFIESEPELTILD